MGNEPVYYFTRTDGFVYFSPQDIAIWACFAGLLVLGIYKLTKNRRSIATWVGLIPVVFFLLSIGYPTQNFHDSACTENNTCYHLAEMFVPTDSVYEIWYSRREFGKLARMDHLSELLDYSEDGKYTSTPSLVLSGNEQILAVKRGGLFTDAYSFQTSNTLTKHVSWRGPNVEEKMKSRSLAIESIIKENLK